MLGLLRLLTNQKVMGDRTTSLAGALQLYDRWAQDPHVQLAAEPRGAETLFRQAIAPFALRTATKAVADCYLIGFAEAAGAHVVTFDRALAATALFRQVPVALLEPVEMRKCHGRPSEWPAIRCNGEPAVRAGCRSL